MKKLFMLFALFLGVSFLSASSPKSNSAGSVDWNKAENNYIANLRSDNAGVITSAAGYIRKYNMTGAAEELKRLLSKENADNVKMAAALTLLAVGGEEGRKAVEAAVEKEESEVVVEFYRSVLHTTASEEN
jgi:single-stranded DNA-specific DHH superfamily exonuclease